MQKVSKQSLAMIALSILLAISIALTFTFAAIATDSKTAKGTITFTGALASVISGFDGTSVEGTFKIEIDPNGTVSATSGSSNSLSEMKIGLASTSAPAYFSVELEYHGDNIVAESGAESFAANQTAAIGVSVITDGSVGRKPLQWKGSNILYSANKVAAGTVWTLDTILNFYVDTTRYVGSEEEDYIILKVNAYEDKVYN